MMEVDEPLSSLEAQRAPALDTEEGLLIPVAGPETPFRPTSGMPGLTPTGEHVTALQFDEEQTGTTCEKISRTNPEMEQPMQEERLAILEHPVVSGISDVLLSRGQRHGFRVSLRCQTAQQNGHGVCDCGGLRQGVPVRVSKTRATLLACLQVHMDMKINQVVVMYLDAEEIVRPESPPVVSVCKGILTSYSFLFLGTQRHYAMRRYSCWCPACSRVRGRGPASGTVSDGAFLKVPNCDRKELSVWKEAHFTVTQEAGIQQRKKRVAEMITKELAKAKPGAWGCVQAREQWSEEEQIHLRPGHHWIFEFGEAPDGTSCEFTFAFSPLQPKRNGVVYKGMRFYNGDRALKVKRWLHRVAEDASGLTFEEWDPTKDVDNSQPPVPMIINSSELRGAGFNLQEVIPPALEAAARSGRRTRGAGVRQVEGLGRKRFVLSADDDNDLRSRCE